MGTTLNKLEYINTTKSQMKTALNQFGAGITDETTFREYADKINDIYDNWEKVTGEGTDITLTPTKKGKLDYENGIVGYGDTYQEGTPTPDSPQNIQSVTGEQEEVVNSANIFNQDWFLNATDWVKTDGVYTGKPYDLRQYLNNTLEFNNFEPNAQYTLSFKAYSDVRSNFRFIFTYTDDTVSEIFIDKTSMTSYSGTSDAGKTIKTLTGNYGSNQTTHITDFMLNKGTTVLPYSAYQTPQTKPINLGTIELNKIGTYQDYIYKSGGNWYKHEVIGIHKFDGTETFSYTTNYSGFRYKNEDMNINSTNPQNDLLCTHFTIATQRGSTGGTIPVIKTYTNTSDKEYLFICDGGSDETTFKAWLTTQYNNNNPVTIKYKKLEAQDIPITDTNLISQLEAWYNAQSYNGTTIITSSGSLPMVVKVSALKKGGN